MPDEILITGTSGFIGRHCAITFADAGRQVTALDLRPAPEDVALRARVLCTDLADQRVLDEVRSGRFAAVVNQAGISSTVEQDRERLQRVNVDAPVALAAACASSGTRFVYASSHSVYGSFPRGTLIAEDAGADLCSGPLNAYAESKLRLDREMAQAPADLNWVGLRYTNVFGSGEEHKGKMTSILSQLVRQAAADVPVRLFADSLTASRDYIPVEVVARTCLALIDTPVPSGVYNLGSGAPVSFATLLEWSASFVRSPLVPRQATFAPSRRPARSPTALRAWEVPPLAAPAESPSTSSTRTSGRHAESTLPQALGCARAGGTPMTPLLDGQTLPATALAVHLVANPLSDRYQYWTGADLTKLRAALPALAHVDQNRIHRGARELFDEFRAGQL